MANEKVVLVTGSTDGIGRETARGLLQQGCRVIVHGRSAAKVEAAREALRGTGPGTTAAWVCDLSSLQAIRDAVPALRAAWPRIDVLLHNAGILSQERRLSADGIELTLAVNHLAPFLLTHLLLDSVQAARPARIVLVASQVHAGASLDLGDLQLARSYSGYAAYAQSKLCNVLFAAELAERLQGTSVTANSLHPGVVGTKLLRQGFGMSGGPDSLEQGAATSIHLALAPEVAEVSGRYFVRSREAHCSRLARDAELRAGLWEASERLTGIAPGAFLGR